MEINRVFRCSVTGGATVDGDASRRQGGTFKTRPNGEKEPDVGKENKQRHLRGAR